MKLPLDGSMVNRELARTFNPNKAESRRAYPSGKIGLKYRTPYEEDFGTASEIIGAPRAQSLKPKSDTHIREDAKMLYRDSVTHEAFRSPSHGFQGRPAAFSPPHASGPEDIESPFLGKSRYAEEFVNLTNQGYRVELAKGRDDSNRVKGSSIPNKLRDYMFAHGVDACKKIDVDSVFRSTESHRPGRPDQAMYNNPFLSDYLSS